MKKVLIGSLVALTAFILIINLYLLNSMVNKKETKKIDNNISLMLETDFSSNKYETSNDNKWPGEDYSFNKKLSRCENGSKLEWNEETRSIKMITDKTDKCYVYFYKNTIDYKYTGDVQTLNITQDGTYKIELWGAQGGDYGDYTGGKGAYTVGNIELKKDNILYIYVGEQGFYGKKDLIPFNGGGKTIWTLYGATGGGATDFRIESGNWNEFESLKSRIMVAAGGGGANHRNKNDVTDVYYGAGNGGAGGALTGEEGKIDLVQATNPSGNYVWGYFTGTGGTQTKGGICNLSEHDDNVKTDFENFKPLGNFGYTLASQSGGGGGYYAGGGGEHAGAGGGSSYISGYKGCVAIQEESTVDNVMPKENCTDGTKDITCSYHYSGKIFTDANMIAGNAEMPNPLGGTEIGHSGDGYARITIIE